jgi:3-dehydroquinate synthase
MHAFITRIGAVDVPVAAGSSAWSHWRRILDELRPRGILPVVTDATVERLGYSDQVVRGIEAAGEVSRLTILQPGEASKCYATIERLHGQWADWCVPRDGLVVALGGGVVSDVTGFAAATWLRGVRWVSCPTTVEGMVDAAIGGKTGINLPQGKNLVGAFHQPSALLVNIDVLRTLPRRDLVAGLAESIKHAAIYDVEFFDWHRASCGVILRNEADAITDLVVRNIRTKAAIIGPDERDVAGRRIFLNFGHTIGHAIEAAVHYRLRHGECVALGMVAASFLSADLGLLSAADAGRLVDLLAAFGLPVRLPELVAADRIMKHLAHDKKFRDDRLRFVLLEAIGRACVVDAVDEARIRAAIASIT